jgi:hypothetical protein
MGVFVMRGDATTKALSETEYVTSLVSWCLGGDFSNSL